MNNNSNNNSNNDSNINLIYNPNIDLTNDSNNDSNINLNYDTYTNSNNSNNPNKSGIINDQFLPSKSTKIYNIKSSNDHLNEFRPINKFNDKITGEVNLDNLKTKIINKDINKLPPIKHESLILGLNDKTECRKETEYNPDDVKPYISKVDPERLNKLSEIANKQIAKKSFMDLTLFEISFGLYENINFIMSDLQTFFYMLSNGTASSKQFINIFIKDYRTIYVGITILLISFILFIIN